MQGIMLIEPLYNQVLNGLKKQTRRTDGLQKVNTDPGRWQDPLLLMNISSKKEPFLVAVFAQKRPFKKKDNYECELIECLPRYKKGEILYLKENYSNPGPNIIYQYDFPVQDRKSIKWKSKLLMPAKFARQFVKVVNWRVERLKSISDGDAISEGIATKTKGGYISFKDYSVTSKEKFSCAKGFTARKSFLTLWSSINGEESLQANPWVFVYELEYVQESNIINEAV